MPPSNQRSFELSIRGTRTQGNESEPQESPTTPQQLLQLVRRRIVEAEGPEYFEYQQVSLEAGSFVVRSFSRDGNVEQANPTLSYNTLDRVLSVTMSSMTHGSAFLWGVTEMIDSLSQRYFTRDEFRYLMMGGNDGRKSDYYVHAYTMDWISLINLHACRILQLSRAVGHRQL